MFPITEVATLRWLRPLHHRYMALQHKEAFLMTWDLISLLVDEVALFQTSGTRDLAPWPRLSWRLFVPLVFATNVIVAVLAWWIVDWFAKLM